MEDPSLPEFSYNVISQVRMHMVSHPLNCQSESHKSEHSLADRLELQHRSPWRPSHFGGTWEKVC